ncbi:MAG: ribosome hibernation-promoting factor, HPF/YfiA family [Lachnospirales bacterium]
MNYTFVGKGMTVTEGMKEKAKDKIDDRLSRYISDDTKIGVTFSTVKKVSKIEVTVHLPKRTLRAETIHEDMYAAIDLVVDIAEKQISKYKARLKDKSQRNKKFADEFSVLPVYDDSDVEVDDEVVKVKKFPVKPMSVEEAIMEMELVGHNFYVYRDAESNEVNVVYKRVDNGYGVIEPEL